MISAFNIRRLQEHQNSDSDTNKVANDIAHDAQWW